MKNGFGISVLVIMVSSITLCNVQSASAFHSGSKGECKECHEAKSAALRGSDASSTCLRCHQAPQGVQKPAGYYIATNAFDLKAGMPPSQLTPGGDFGYLKKNYSWLSPGGHVENSPGERHGHNLVAEDYGYEADSKNLTTPRGIYPGNKLSCISCHDPHGTIASSADAGGSYRMLGGVGYKTSLAPDMVFIAPPPVAVAPREYNRTEAAADTRVAYGTGMSEWCSNCHTGGCAGAYGHPVCSGARFTTETSSNYNAYVKSGDINGRADASYNALIPFEEGTEDRSILTQHAKTDNSYLKGPDYRANVTCLTCHRAHASGWDFMARWNMSVDFIVHNGNYPGSNNGSPSKYAQGRTATETQRAFYDRPPARFASFQRGLCNKCHIRD